MPAAARCIPPTPRTIARSRSASSCRATPDDVVQAVEVCRAHDAPIVSRGGGTSLAGQTCNVAVVLDHSKYNNELVELDPDERWRARPARDRPRRAARRRRAPSPDLRPDPATHDHCTLGGMIGNNSCGVHSVMAGKTDDNVIELDVLAYDGTRLRVGRRPTTSSSRRSGRGGRPAEIYQGMRGIRRTHADEIRARFPDIPRRVSGYNLPQLLPEHGFDVARGARRLGVDAASTVLEAKVRLVPSPPAGRCRRRLRRRLRRRRRRAAR